MRSNRTRLIAGSLAVLVMLLSLASVSPELHDLLHAHNDHRTDAHSHTCSDHPEQPANETEESDSHFCAVTLLASGIAFTASVQLPQQGDLQFVSLSTEHEKVWFHQVSTSQSARGPPTLIVA